MSTIIQTIQQYVSKNPPDPKPCIIKSEEDDLDTMNDDDVKENDAGQSPCDKKTDEVKDNGSNGSLLWRMSSGLYSTATGAVGYGVGSVKWVAGKTYDVGSTVVSHVKVPSVSTLKRKDKKE
ncbi:uncharacterized protein LOC144625407 [Crassostrea virginica]